LSNFYFLPNNVKSWHEYICFIVDSQQYIAKIRKQEIENKKLPCFILLHYFFMMMFILPLHNLIIFINQSMRINHISKFACCTHNYLIINFYFRCIWRVLIDWWINTLKLWRVKYCFNYISGSNINNWQINVMSWKIIFLVN
jgi:hypothetical protein